MPSTSRLPTPADRYARMLRDRLPELHERYGVASLGLFGSYVRGEQREGSDLDLLVEFEHTPDLIEFVTLKNYLSDTLGANVDLVMKSALKPRIGQSVLREVVEI